jgi:hypothetical protein
VGRKAAAEVPDGEGDDAEHGDGKEEEAGSQGTAGGEVVDVGAEAVAEEEGGTTPDEGGGGGAEEEVAPAHADKTGGDGNVDANQGDNATDKHRCRVVTAEAGAPAGEGAAGVVRMLAVETGDEAGTAGAGGGVEDDGAEKIRRGDEGETADQLGAGIDGDAAGDQESDLGGHPGRETQFGDEDHHGDDGQTVRRDQIKNRLFHAGSSVRVRRSGQSASLSIV